MWTCFYEASKLPGSVPTQFLEDKRTERRTRDRSRPQAAGDGYLKRQHTRLSHRTEKTSTAYSQSDCSASIITAWPLKWRSTALCRAGYHSSLFGTGAVLTPFLGFSFQNQQSSSQLYRAFQHLSAQCFGFTPAIFGWPSLLTLTLFPPTAGR